MKTFALDEAFYWLFPIPTPSVAKVGLARGLGKDAAWCLAGSGKGWWRKTNSPQARMAMTIAWFEAEGLAGLQQRYLALQN